VFPNRTAREKGFLACSDCGMEEEEEAVRAHWEGEGESEQDPGLSGPPAFSKKAGQALEDAVHAGRERVANLSPKGRIIAGTALLGVATGLVLAGVFRKR